MLKSRTLHSSVPRQGDHGGLSQHRDTPDNTIDTPFDFTEANTAEIKKILAKYPVNYKQAATIPLLHLAQYQTGGWVPLAAMNKIAKILEIPPMKVYEVATFYTMFNRTKVGKHHVQLCTTTPCQLGGCGSTVILETIKKHLNIGVGETTADGLFTLTEVECLGACVNAPMLQIGDDYFEDLTPESTVALLETLKAGKTPKVGPQTGGRKNCEGPQGKTTLFAAPAGPYCRPDLETCD